MKKISIISLLTVLALLVTSLCSVQAAVVISDDNGIYYTVQDDQTSIFVSDYDISTTPDVVIPREYLGFTVTGILSYAFENNQTLETLSFSEASELVQIGADAFAGCISLQSVVVPNSITNIGSGVFRKCTSLEQIEFYGNEDYVPVQLCSGCTNLKSVRLSAYTTGIGNYAFSNCPALEYIEIPSTVNSIGNSAFLNDSSLTLGVFYNSYAYEYAKERNIPFVLLDSVTMGDVNSDGKVNVNDVTALQRHLALMEMLNDLQLKAADYDGDGSVAVADVTAIQRRLAEFND